MATTTQNNRSATRDGSTNEGLRDRASARFEGVRGSTAEQIDASPLVALAGGIALGALIAAVLPQTERESALLEPVGAKVTDAGKQAVDKVREAGKAKVDELAGDRVREFFGLGGTTAA